MAPSEILLYVEEDRVALLKEFNRTPDSIKDDINSIKIWLEKQPHLPEIPNDEKIEKFLFIGKFIFAKVKTTIDLYYSSRSLLPEFFKDPDCEEMQNIIELLYFFPLPKLTENHCRVLIHKLRMPQSSSSLNMRVDSGAYFSYCINLADIFINEDCPCPKIMIYDGTNLSMDFVSSFSPVVIRKAVIIFEKVFSHRMQQIHIVNMPQFLESFLILIKSFMNSKVARRIQIHKNMDHLSDFISKEILPVDYSGTEKSLETLHSLWRDKLKKCSPLFRERNSLRTNETLRPNNEPMDCEMLGIQGNFKKLDVD